MQQDYCVGTFGRSIAANKKTVVQRFYAAERLVYKQGLSDEEAVRMVKVYINAWKLFGNSYICE